MSESIPKTLYKYVSSADAVTNLINGRLKFATIPQLNDPCEMLADLDEDKVAKSLQFMRKIGYSDDEFNWLKRQGTVLAKLAPDFPAIPVPSNAKDANKILSSQAYDNMKLMRMVLQDVVEKIRSEVGVLSLSASATSLPMWAHYSRNAAGFVVVFDDLKGNFSGDDTGCLSAVRPVQYTGEFLGMTFVPSTLNNLFFWKHSDWSYEREFRVVRPLQDCQPIEAEGGKIYLHNIDPKYVGSVILGWKTTVEDRHKVEKAIALSGRPISILQAKIQGGKIAF